MPDGLPVQYRSVRSVQCTFLKCTGLRRRPTVAALEGAVGWLEQAEIQDSVKAETPVFNLDAYWPGSTSVVDDGLKLPSRCLFQHINKFY